MNTLRTGIEPVPLRLQRAPYTKGGHFGLTTTLANTLCVNTCQSANPILWASGRCGQDHHGSSPCLDKTPAINGQWNLNTLLLIDNPPPLRWKFMLDVFTLIH